MRARKSRSALWPWMTTTLSAAIESVLIELERDCRSERIGSSEGELQSTKLWRDFFRHQR
jgi:hypothetical protein